MRVVVQRVRYGRVRVDEKIVGEIKHGFVVLVGFTHDDSEQDLIYIVEKVTGLRVFEDEQEKMNHSILDVNGSILSVSQFTLYGDVRKGRRPNFMQAAAPELAVHLYNQFNDRLRTYGLQVETGEFGAKMDVELANDGPVTILLDSKRSF